MDCIVRPVRETDFRQIIAIDARITGIDKTTYWSDVFDRYGGGRRPSERFFFVATPDGDDDGQILGYVIGEVRAWEFGSAPCGWVFAFSVDPDAREMRIGEQLFEAVSDAFRNAGIRTMRTMVPRDNELHMAFFRSEGMMAGPYLQLEKDLS